MESKKENARKSEEYLVCKMFRLQYFTFSLNGILLKNCHGIPTRKIHINFDVIKLSNSIKK